MIDDEDNEINRVRAAVGLNPVLRARHTLNDLTGRSCDPWALATELKEQLKAVNSGDLSNAEAMLFTQAHILDQLFNNLIGNAVNPESAIHMEACLKLAFKAQGQCRATLETLSAIKNPPVVYAKQANFAAGHQQINNNGPAPGEKVENQQSKLVVEVNNGSTNLDNGTTGATIGSDSATAALGARYRPENKRG